jgi:replicative DNA helicase
MPNASDTATPAALEAERTLLGAVLLDDQQMVHVADVLPPQGGPWFYHQPNHLIYDAMLTLFERREPIDLVGVTDVLRRRGHLDKAGGSVYLSGLMDEAVTTQNVAYHARLVRDKALLRSVINISTELQASAYEQDDLQNIVGQATQALLTVANAQATSAFTKMDALVRGSIDECEHAQQHEPVGIPTGFHELDHYLYGFQPTDLIIVAARPGMGKTSLGLQFAVTAARHPPRLPVAVFSLEMSKQQLSMRMVCAEARIDSSRVRRGFIDHQEHGQFMNGAGRLYELPILVDDTPSVSVLDIRARCQRLQADGGLGMVVVDYLRLIAPTRCKDSRQQEVSDISCKLKILAKELHVPVIALSQLSRAVEQRGDKIPQLSDLRDSGAIEQDADVIMFIYQPGMYDKNSEDQTAHLIIAKQPNGPLGEVQLAFHDAYARFDPLADGHHHAMAAQGGVSANDVHGCGRVNLPHRRWRSGPSPEGLAEPASLGAARAGRS